MRHFVECLGKVQVEHIDIGPAVDELGDLVEKLEQIGDSGAMLEEPMLGQTD